MSQNNSRVVVIIDSRTASAYAHVRRLLTVRLLTVVCNCWFIYKMWWRWWWWWLPVINRLTWLSVRQHRSWKNFPGRQLWKWKGGKAKTSGTRGWWKMMMSWWWGYSSSSSSSRIFIWRNESESHYAPKGRFGKRRYQKKGFGAHLWASFGNKAV